MSEMIILVDEKDNQTGTAGKMEAHQNGGKLHRAFSICVFNSKGEMMLQMRAKSKYHCGGLWTNACCSHPRDGETIEHAIHRRLMEEMGFDCLLKEIFSMIYRAPFENGLTEHEFDHFYFGKFDGEPKPNPEEVGDWKWANVKELLADAKKNPKKYTPWFVIGLGKMEAKGLLK